MKVTSQLLENRQAALTIEVEDERVQKALQGAARRLANKLNIPGYRKGKAPYNVVLRAVGEDGLYEEAIDELGQQVYREALDESQLEPYGPAQMDDVQFKPLVFKLTVPLHPVIDLRDYRALRVPYTQPEVPPEEIEQVLKGLQERHAIFEPVGEGPVEPGQIAVLDIEGKLGQGEDAPVVMHEHEVDLLVADTTDFPFPGFIQHVVGMKVGEEKSFEMVAPEDDTDEELRGKTVHFEVKLNDLKLRTLPALDDAFAQTVGAYETLDALRDVIRASQLQTAKRDADSKYADECMLKLVEQSQVEFPPFLVDEEVERIVERTEQRLKEQKLSLDEFLNIKKQTRDQYREEMRPKAENNVKRGLVLSDLTMREAIKVSPDEVTIMINMLSANYGKDADRVRESFASDEARQSLMISLLSDKAVARVVSICKGENPPLPSDEPEKDEELALATEPAAEGEVQAAESQAVVSEEPVAQPAD